MRLLAGLNEGYIKWLSLNRNQSSINYAAVELVDQRLVNPEGSVSPMVIYLSDHKAKTLQLVVDTLAQFNKDWPNDNVQFLGAAGPAGFEAATNIVVKKTNREMMFYVYAAVILLSFITFRSFAGPIGKGMAQHCTFLCFGSIRRHVFQDRMILDSEKGNRVGSSQA